MANEVNPKQGAQENITGAVREYVGARYVPLFAEPITWDNTQTYEPLTIVVYQGNSYTSRQYVPTGIEITNTDYWALTGNYNAQIEQYRSEVSNISSNVTELSTNFTNFQNTTDTQLQSIVSVNNEQTQDIEELNTRIDNLNPKRLLVIGDSWSDPSWEPGVSGKWVDDVANDFGFTSVTNISESGAGFAHVNSLHGNFNQILTYNLPSIENKEEFTHVIVYGGLNDLNNNETYSACATGLDNLIASLYNNFPNALIHVVGVNATQKMQPSNCAPLIALCQISRSARVFFHNSDSWFAITPTVAQFLDGKSSHPGVNGNAYIRHFMYKILCNEPCGIDGWIRISFNSVGDLFYPIIDNKLYIQSQFINLTLSGSVNVGSVTSNINIPSMMVPIYSQANSNAVGWMEISSTQVIARLPSAGTNNAYSLPCGVFPLYM